jgi:low temperature requirement protein LtrA
MAADNQRGALFRTHAPHRHSRVTYAELFFDLVFVFAVTQRAHHGKQGGQKGTIAKGGWRSNRARH